MTRKRNVHLEMTNLELQRRKNRGMRIRRENEKIEKHAVHSQKIEAR